jgi:pyruvate dehydrogenase E1 component beta subunit
MPAPPSADSSAESTRILTMARAGREAVIDEMRKDASVFVIGEDVGKLGGIFGTAVGVQEEFGAWRAIDTPISETGFIGIACGAAMAGMRPLVELAYVDFFGVCFNQIYNFAAKTHYMSGGQYRMPLTMMIGVGGGYNNAAQHSQCVYGTFAHMPGIKVVVPSNAYDAKGLMHSCIRDDNLTLWMVHKATCGLGWLGTPLKTSMAAVPEEAYTVPFGKARIWREGTDVTLVGLGLTVHHCLQAADVLAAEGVSGEVIDLRTVVPLDRAAIFDSVAKTGRLVVVDEDYLSFGITGEIVASITERDPGVWKAAPRRVAYPDVPVPFSRPLEDFCLPDAVKVAAAARTTLGRQ